jgi:hypothetical protein
MLDWFHYSGNWTRPHDQLHSRMADLQPAAAQHDVSRHRRISRHRFRNFSEASISRNERVHSHEHCGFYDALDDLDYFRGESGKPNCHVAVPALREIFLRRPRRSARTAKLVAFTGTMLQLRPSQERRIFRRIISSRAPHCCAQITPPAPAFHFLAPPSSNP